MAFFPLFCNLPVELQLAIWALAAAQDPPQPEVCIAWPLKIDDYPTAHDAPTVPFIVDTAWPAGVHVCRAAREVALGTLRLRHSPVAGFAVPFRHFIPAIDTLYVGLHQVIATLNFFGRPENAALARQMRRVAFEASCISGAEASHVATFIRQRAANLQSLSVVLPGTCDIPAYGMLFLPPARRCRLRDMPGETVDGLKVTKIPVMDLEEHETLPMPLRVYFEKRRGDMARIIHSLAVTGDEGTAWSDRDGTFGGLEIKAQTFVEYRYCTANSPQEQWVEVCEERLLGKYDLGHEDGARAPQPRPVPPAARKDPEQHRVLDDDSGWYSWEEYRSTLPRGDW